MTDKKKVRVAVMTPYLKEEGWMSPEMRRTHEVEGWDVGGDCADYVRTARYDVHLDKAIDGPESLIASDLTIIGSAGRSEGLVDWLKGSGAIVCRYSMFHGGPSRYTGRMPGEGGFSIDLPKSESAVYALLSDESFLDAIVARDEGAILSALDDLGARGFEIMATPYLREALKV